MRVISFDVGIKNLAYCIIEYTHIEKSKKYDIITWNTINLVSDKEHKCSELLKSKSKKIKSDRICNKKAQYCGKVGKDKYRYYCGTHMQNHEILKTRIHNYVETKILEETSNISQCSYMMRTHNKCTKFAKFSYLGKCYCKSHKEIIVVNVKKQYELFVVKKTNSNREKLYGLATTMYDKLDEIPNILDVNLVLIENQPTTLNPIMKTISSLILGYFVMKKKMDKCSKISDVLFISPTNKLKVDENKTLIIVKAVPDKTEKMTKYKMTKKMGIEYTKILLDGNIKWLDYLSNHKKKDDLCDAFLQGYYYYTKNF